MTRACMTKRIPERVAKHSGANAKSPMATAIQWRLANFPSDSRHSRNPRKESRKSLRQRILRRISGAIREARNFLSGQFDAEGLEAVLVGDRLLCLFVE